ncbi:uncharacterized protein [Arachis hypogaea]|uniref:uncharacterized protein n=1 Tax=Arachis hypogaea TaxID=3818 RepID=UPI000DECC6B2|nr:uncharacterized protein LOC112735210 [Arachis hypogaea]
MAEHVDYLLDLNPTKITWNFKVYVIRIWEVPSKYNEKEVGSIQMILQDSKGDRMHAKIPRSLISKWKGSIVQFQNYQMTHFIVVANDMDTIITPSKWILCFSHRTRVIHVENPYFPLEAFYFKPIPDLLNADKANRINCILFGNMVDQILPQLEDGRVEPLIVLFQYFRAIRWNGKTSIQSNFDVSQMHFDNNLKEIMEFQKRVAKYLMLLSVSPSSSVRITQVPSQHAWSGADELNQGSVFVKAIEEALGLVQEGPCWISATIVAINATNKDWFYKTCRRCPKKVESSIGNRYECNKCGHTHGCAALRFKVEVMVYDSTGSISLLLWDREITQLCDKREEQVMEEDEIGDDEYPPILDNMMDKRVLFKINVKSANINHRDQVYTVMKVCDDDEIIQKNLPKKMQSNQSISIIEINCSNSVDMFENIIHLNVDADPQFSDILDECVSSLKHKTSSKRASSGMKYGFNSAIDNNDDGQFSTNKFSRKYRKGQKIQVIEGDE